MSIRVDRDQRGPTTQRMGAVPMLGWVAALVVAAALAWALYALAFPFAPGETWTLRPSEAEAIAFERFTDLGALPDSPYTTVVLQRQRLLELQLLEVDAPELERDVREGILSWLITVYPKDASSDGWSHQAELTLDGRVLRLLSGVDQGFNSRQQLTIEDAVSRADRLLERSGRSLEDFYDPVERLVEMTSFSYQLLRYERRPSQVEPAEPAETGVRSGVDVQFAADELLGFYSWEELDTDPRLDANLKRVQQIESAQALLVFLLLAIVVAVFVVRYHQGLVGARRGTQVAIAILAAAFVVLLASARTVSEGWSFAGLSRSEITLAWIGLMSIVYLPALALLGGLSFAVGESLVRGSWRARLASFDGFASARWANATVAASSLRGVAAGVMLLALLLAASIVSRHYGVRVPLSLQLGAPWESAQWPAVSLLLSQAALSTVTLSFVLLFLLPQLRQKLPSTLSFALAALGLTFFFAAPVVTVPAWGCLPTVVLSSVVIVALFVRYDFLVAWLAHLIASVGVGALTLMTSGDTLLQVQGLGILLVASSPLVASARYLTTSRLHDYAYEEVPPHVRRIADRERQRVELETAKGIQTSILPELPDEICGVEVAHTYQPATEVGGDFYDVIALDDGRLAIAVGDVAGHGVSSGLIMSMVRAALAVQVGFSPEVELVLPALNKVVCGSARKRLLTTACYALLEPDSGQLQFACAGHVYPYRLSPEGYVEALVSISYPLGVRAELNVDRQRVALKAGDTLIFSTDGLVETSRLGGSELFGFERLEASLAKHAGASPQELRDAVLRDLDRFALSGEIVGKPDRDQSMIRDDDLTLLILRIPG